MPLPIRKAIVKLRMLWCDIRGHHGKQWNYEAGEHYLGMKQSKYWKKHHPSDKA